MAGLSIGLAGWIGAGKSEVRRLLQERGYPCIDADSEAHVLYRSSAALRVALIGAFGPDIVTGEGIDRARIAGMVFSDPVLLARLEAIVHPELRNHLNRKARELLASPSSRGAVFIEAAAMPRWPDWIAGLDAVWEVRAAEHLRLSRLVSRRGLSLKDAQARIRAQRSFAPIAHPRLVSILNEGNLEELSCQVESELQKLGLQG